MELDLSTYSLPVLEALASKTRINILLFIGNNKKSIGEIAQNLKLSNAIVTRHVQQMEDAGLLGSERGIGTNRNKKLVYLKVDNILPNKSAFGTFHRLPCRTNMRTSYTKRHRWINRRTKIFYG